MAEKVGISFRSSCFHVGEQRVSLRGGHPEQHRELLAQPAVRREVRWLKRLLEGERIVEHGQPDTGPLGV
jgi:hypothetical protein